MLSELLAAKPLAKDAAAAQIGHIRESARRLTGWSTTLIADAMSDALDISDPHGADRPRRARRRGRGREPHARRPQGADDQGRQGAGGLAARRPRPARARRSTTCQQCDQVQPDGRPHRRRRRAQARRGLDPRQGQGPGPLAGGHVAPVRPLPAPLGASRPAARARPGSACRSPSASSSSTAARSRPRARVRARARSSRFCCLPSVGSSA